VVLDHNTVIFQKKKGGGGTYKNYWYVRKAVIIICQTSNQIATMEESYCSSKFIF
jgi:hypothetical protein